MCARKASGGGGVAFDKTRQDKSEGDGNTWVTNKPAERMQKSGYEGRGAEEEEEAYDCSNLC